MLDSRVGIAFHYRKCRLFSFRMLPGHGKANNKIPSIIKRIECIDGNGKPVERKTNHDAGLQVIAGKPVDGMLNRKTGV